MKKIAFHTLGCKVNQYDTQAMRELFERAGYECVDFSDSADIYLINTCTVTGTGDQKSMKLIRRVAREHEGADVIVCGCLAQRDPERVMALPGVRLALGVKLRGEVVKLYEGAVRDARAESAVQQDGEWKFEHLSVNRHDGKTRAVMKIQEGCDRFCAYCVIPNVRGPVRHMPLGDIAREAARLAGFGYSEIVLTGIHLASYGRGSPDTLIDAIRAVHDTQGVARVRLGSLEPPLITDEFVRALKGFPGLCPQFHLSMQSGSTGVLMRMRRRYTPDEYYEAVQRLRSAFEDCAITTDVLTGFPGETDDEARETLEFVRKVGFARIHVFPYSRRAGTLADSLPDHVPEHVKQRRARDLIALGNQLESSFVENMVGKIVPVLFETRHEGGASVGYSPNYVKVIAEGLPGEIARVKIDSASGDTAYGSRKD